MHKNTDLIKIYMDYL